MTLGFSLALLLLGCGSRSGPTKTESATGGTTPASGSPSTTVALPEGAYALVGGTVLGLGPADVVVQDDRILSVGEPVPDGLETVDVSGRCIGPGFIDSHVHLAYLPEAAAMRAGGVVAAVDLAAPVPWLGTKPDDLVIVAAGPMITAIDGYPTQSWGSNGYGLEVAGETEAAAGVAALADAGAGVIKLAMNGAPALTDAEISAAVGAAHDLDLKVVAHATTDAEAARAATLGVDVLAHTPTQALTDETVALWADRAVISTVRAFGGSATTLDNLARLRAAGATVLYGTDFGNTRDPGIDEVEVGLLADAGLDPAAIRRAATEDPAAYWGLEADFGAVAPGKRAELWIGDCACAWCD